MKSSLLVILFVSCFVSCMRRDISQASSDSGVGKTTDTIFLYSRALSDGLGAKVVYSDSANCKIVGTLCHNVVGDSLLSALLMQDTLVLLSSKIELFPNYSYGIEELFSLNSNYNSIDVDDDDGFHRIFFNQDDTIFFELNNNRYRLDVATLKGSTFKKYAIFVGMTRKELHSKLGVSMSRDVRPLVYILLNPAYFTTNKIGNPIHSRNDYSFYSHMVINVDDTVTSVVVEESDYLVEMGFEYLYRKPPFQFSNLH